MEFRNGTHVEPNCLTEVEPVQDVLAFVGFACWWYLQSYFPQPHPELGDLMSPNACHLLFIYLFSSPISHFSWGGFICQLYLPLICLAPGGPEQNPGEEGGSDGGDHLGG